MANESAGASVNDHLQQARVPMSSLPKKSPGFACRGRERQVRQLRLEALERRDCPAVMFELAGGVLLVTGDEGPNAIEFTQRSDGVAEVLGDGQRHRFEGVNKIVVRTGDGNDRVQGTIYLWVRDVTVNPTPVPFTLELDTGAGNDTIRIDDGSLLALRDLNDPQAAADIHVGLGTGADAFSLQTDNHVQMDLELTAEDGADRVAVAIVVPVVQHLRAVEARLSFQLGGDGNWLAVNTKGLDDIDLKLTAAGNNNVVKHELGHTIGLRHEHTRPEATARASLALTGDGNQVGFSTHGYDQVDLDLDLTGNGNDVEVGMLLPAVQKVRDASLRIGTDLEGGSNVMDVRTQHIRDVELNVREGSAALAVAPPTSSGNVFTITFIGSLNIKLDLKTGSGDDTVVVDAQAADPYRFARDPRSSGMVVDLGDGNDVAKFRTTGFTSETLDLTAGSGNDNVQVEATAGRITGIAVDPSAVDAIYTQRVDLGQGDDAADIQTQGFSDISLDLMAGDGNDTVTTRSNVFAIWVTTGFSNLLLDLKAGAGNDEVRIHSGGFGGVAACVDSGEGNDTVQLDSRPGTGILRSTDSGKSFNRELGNFACAIKLGPGDDRLVIETFGYSQADVFIVAGEGDDQVHVRHRMFAIVDRTNLNLVVLLGAGSDILAIDAAGYRKVKMAINSGPEGDGSDSISAHLESLGRKSRRQAGRVTLDGGMDVLQYKALGYLIRQSGQTPISVEYVFVAT